MRCAYPPYGDCRSLANLMHRIANQKPPSATRIRADIPPCVVRIINKALQKKPAERYDNGAQMAEALRRCIESL